MTDRPGKPLQRATGIFENFQQIGTLKKGATLNAIGFASSPIDFGVVLVNTVAKRSIAVTVVAPTFVKLKIAGSPQFTAVLTKAPEPEKPPSKKPVDAGKVVDVVVSEYVPIEVVGNPGEVVINPPKFIDIGNQLPRLTSAEVKTPTGTSVVFRYEMPAPPPPPGARKLGVSVAKPQVTTVAKIPSMTFTDNVPEITNVAPGGTYSIEVTFDALETAPASLSATLTVSFDGIDTAIPLTARTGDFTVALKATSPTPFALGDTIQLPISLTNLGDATGDIAFRAQSPKPGVDVPQQTWTLAPFQQMDVLLKINTSIQYPYTGEMPMWFYWSGSYGTNTTAFDRSLKAFFSVSFKQPQVTLQSFVQALQGQDCPIAVTVVSNGPATHVEFEASGLPDGITLKPSALYVKNGETRSAALTLNVAKTAMVSQTGAPDFTFTVQYSAYGGAFSGTQTITLRVDNIFEIQPQIGANWCWAAVTASVFDFYGGLVTQCELADQFTSTAANVSCCDSPLPGVCDHPDSTQDALNGLGILEQHHKRPLTLAEVTGQIDIGRPVALYIKWAGGGAHAIVISGYVVTNAGATLLIVEDPGNGSSQTLLDIGVLTSNYGGSGTWDMSHTTQPPAQG
jgi:hypothetical protein